MPRTKTTVLTTDDGCAVTEVVVRIKGGPPNEPIRFAIVDDPMIHYAEGMFPHFTLCGVSTEHGKAWATPRAVDCMTCIVKSAVL